MHFPVSIYTGAGHDDAWFISRAESMMKGEWMGDFNQMTLIKGVGYSYFLIFNKFLGTPITLTLAALYLVASLLFVYVLRKIGISKLTALSLFAFLIYQPALFPTRIIRDNIYYSLLLIAISGLMSAVLCKSDKYKIFTIGFSGLCFGLYWITREEGVWVLPGFSFIILYGVFVRSKENGGFRLLLNVLTIYISTALIPPIGTGLVNYYKYGVFQITDFKSSSFTNVLNSLNRVNVGEEIQFLPVPKIKREAIYKVSPSFRELQPYFENPSNEWKRPGCAVYKNTCSDYAGGWFMWALRDGVSSLGYYKDPKSAANYYERVTGEINLACNNRALSCANNVIPFMPRLTIDAIQSIPREIKKAIKLTIYQNEVPLTGGSSGEPLYRLNEIVNFLGNPKIVAPETQSTITISGWYQAPKSDWVYTKCNDGDRQRYFNINRKPSPDIAKYFKDSNSTTQRFSFEISNFGNCSFSFSNPKIQEIQFIDLLKSHLRNFKVSNGFVNFDVVQENSLSNTNKLYLKKFLITVYEQVSIYIFGVGTICFIIIFLLLIFRKYTFDNLTVVALFLWILYYCRIALVVMVDISSFPAINHLYLLPTYPIWSAASFASVAAFLKSIKLMWKLEVRKAA